MAIGNKPISQLPDRVVDVNGKIALTDLIAIVQGGVDDTNGIRQGGETRRAKVSELPGGLGGGGVVGVGSVLTLAELKLLNVSDANNFPEGCLIVVENDDQVFTSIFQLDRNNVEEQTTEATYHTVIRDPSNTHTWFKRAGFEIALISGGWSAWPTAAARDAFYSLPNISILKRPGMLTNVYADLSLSQKSTFAQTSPTYLVKYGNILLTLRDQVNNYGLVGLNKDTNLQAGNLAFTQKPTSLVVNGDKAYIAFYDNDNIKIIDLLTFTVIATIAINDPFTPLVAGNHIAVLSEAVPRTIHFINADTNVVNATLVTDSYPRLYSDGFLYCGNETTVKKVNMLTFLIEGSVACTAGLFPAMTIYGDILYVGGAGSFNLFRVSLPAFTLLPPVTGFDGRIYDIYIIEGVIYTIAGAYTLGNTNNSISIIKPGATTIYKKVKGMLGSYAPTSGGFHKIGNYFFIASPSGLVMVFDIEYERLLPYIFTSTQANLISIDSFEDGKIFFADRNANLIYKFELIDRNGLYQLDLNLNDWLKMPKSSGVSFNDTIIKESITEIKAQVALLQANQGAKLILFPVGATGLTIGDLVYKSDTDAYAKSSNMTLPAARVSGLIVDIANVEAISTAFILPVGEALTSDMIATLQTSAVVVDTVNTYYLSAGGKPQLSAPTAAGQILMKVLQSGGFLLPTQPIVIGALDIERVSVTTTGNDAVAFGTRRKVVYLNSAAAINRTPATLPVSQDNTEILYINKGVGTVTIIATISGVVNPTITTNNSLRIISDNGVWSKI